MAITDFSLKNESIKAFFEGSDKYVPVSELLYLHTHPLIQPNFLTEIEAVINDTSDYMVMKNMRGAIVDRFVGLSVQLGKNLPVESEEQSREVLGILRQIYKLCKSILK
jgi:hypothetical protein